LLCTDGLSGHIPDAELPLLLEQPGSVEERVRALISLAYDRGANDNLTAILAKF
jgi:protein phosphatase